MCEYQDFVETVSNKLYEEDFGMIKNEADFSRKIQVSLNRLFRVIALSIEPREQQPGFPDLLVTKGSNYMLIEVKVPYINNKMVFKKTQLLFYKKHVSDMNIFLCFYDFKLKAVCFKNMRDIKISRIMYTNEIYSN